jgi:hypothetical protein
MSARVLKILVVACAVVGGILTWSALQPADRPADHDFLSSAQIEPATRDLLIRACADCHSDATRYPWYSVLPYVSRMIDDDVRRGREHLNLSKWSEYSRLRRQRALTGIANQVKDRLMPMPEYVRLHPAARLTDAEVNAVFEWAEKERLRLIIGATR